MSGVQNSVEIASKNNSFTVASRLAIISLACSEIPGMEMDWATARGTGMLRTGSQDGVRESRVQADVELDSNKSFIVVSRLTKIFLAHFETRARHESTEIDGTQVKSGHEGSNNFLLHVDLSPEPKWRLRGHMFSAPARKGVGQWWWRPVYRQLVWPMPRTLVILVLLARSAPQPITIVLHCPSEAFCACTKSTPICGLLLLSAHHGPWWPRCQFQQDTQKANITLSASVHLEPKWWTRMLSKSGISRTQLYCLLLRNFRTRWHWRHFRECLWWESCRYWTAFLLLTLHKDPSRLKRPKVVLL